LANALYPEGEKVTSFQESQRYMEQWRGLQSVKGLFKPVSWFMEYWKA